MSSTVRKKSEKQKRKPSYKAMREAFVREIVRDPDITPTEAARRVGYKSPARRASELMRVDWIAKRVAAANEKALQKATDDREQKIKKVLDQLAFIVEHGLVLVPKTSITGAQEKAQDGSPAYKMLDSNAALQATIAQAKILGLFEKKEQKGEDDGTTGVLCVPGVKSKEDWAQ